MRAIVLPGSLGRILLQSFGGGLLILAGVAAFVFFAVAWLPGDIATEILGQSATPETVAAMRRTLGLDRPAPVRFVEWITAMARGDLGTSLANGRPVADLVLGRFSQTLWLAGFAALMAVPTALALGILASLRPGRLFDRLANLGTLAAVSLPEFFLAYILVAFLSVQAGLLPSLATLGPDADLSERLYRSFLPALTLALVTLAHMTRMTRTAILQILERPYCEMAQLKGASRLRVVLAHALPNAAAPIASVVMLNLAYLVVGVVVVEVVFVYPGLGQLMVDSVQKRDIPVVQAASLLFAATYVLLNRFADMGAILADPRLRRTP